MDDLMLAGKKVLITGSSQGIGLAIAKTFAKAGAIVYIHGKNASKVYAVLDQLPGAKAAVYDLAKMDCAQQLYQMTGDIDILISNASIQYRNSWDQITEEEMDLQIAVNFKAAVKLIQQYAPHMLQQNWGRIVTVGSVQQKKPHKDMLIYAATKAAQRNMVQNLAKQFAPYGVTVNNIAPGVIETPRNDVALSDPVYKENVLKGIPCGILGQPEDCSSLILLLCSDAGRYITGEDIYIDGGMQL